MPKLFFRYGTVYSAKSLNLLAIAHNYESQGKKVLLLTSKLDTRNGGYIATRAGLKMKAELVDSSTNIIQIFKNKLTDHENIDCILVDEVHMLDAIHIDQLSEIAHEYATPVICYGLRASYTLKLFPASQRLFELADKLEEIKTVCWYCNSKATQNLKLVDNVPIYKGESIEIGGLEKFIPVCMDCYKNPIIK